MGWRLLFIKRLIHKRIDSFICSCPQICVPVPSQYAALEVIIHADAYFKRVYRYFYQKEKCIGKGNLQTKTSMMDKSDWLLQ